MIITAQIDDITKKLPVFTDGTEMPSFDAIAQADMYSLTGTADEVQRVVDWIKPFAILAEGFMPNISQALTLVEAACDAAAKRNGDQFIVSIKGFKVSVGEDHKVHVEYHP